MADNTTLNPGVSGDTIRDIDKGVGIKTQVVVLDIGGAGVESLVTPANPVPVTTDGVTNTELRATPVPVSGPLTDTQIRATPVAITFGDVPNFDAFTRIRVSNPEHVFDGQFTYDLAPLLYEPVTVAAGGAATVTHEATNRCALMTFTAATTGCAAYLQTYEYFPYQPGRSQLVFVTFNMIEAVANVLKFAGYSDGINGVEFQLNGTTKQFTLYSSTTAGNETVTQANWNIDKLDGTGDSGYTLDITTGQILVLDMQALYTGRVRIGFDIDGRMVICHEFLHANVFAYPYIASANLPVRCGMTGTATVTTTMRFVCCSVISEGGNESALGYNFCADGAVTAASGARTHLVSIQMKPTFNGYVNQAKMVMLEVSILVTGTNPIHWELCLGDVLTGTTTMIDVDATYSGMQYNTLATTSGAPAIVAAGGYVAASSQAKGSVGTDIKARYTMGLTHAGVVRDLGRYTLLVTGLGGTSACYGTLSWREIR